MENFKHIQKQRTQYHEYPRPIPQLQRLLICGQSCFRGSTVNSGSRREHRREQGVVNQAVISHPSSTTGASSWRKEPSGDRKTDPTCLTGSTRKSCELLNTDVRHPRMAPPPHFIITRNSDAALCRTESHQGHQAKSSPSLPVFV